MTTQERAESIRKSNEALARLMAATPTPAGKIPLTTETKTKAEQKAARLAEQEAVLAAKAGKPKATKAVALSKQGDTAKVVAAAIVDAAKVVKAAKATSIGAALDAGKTLTAKSPKAMVKERKAIVAAKAATRATLPAGDPLGMEAGLKAIAKMDVSKAVKKAVAIKAAKPVLNPSIEAVSAGVARVAAKAATVAPAKRPNVKVAILDLFYSNLELQMSTMETVLALQHQYAGMNESSIRVWITDLRKDGTLVKVETRDGKDILTAGVPGTLWGLKGTTSQFCLAHINGGNKNRKGPKAAPVKAAAAIPPSLQAAIAAHSKAVAKLNEELKRHGATL